MKPLVSVIIPTHNRSDMLSQSLRSVLGQVYPHYEVIVIDDGSEEDIPRLLQNFTGPIRYIRQNNAGPSAARNIGIRHATGDLIAFLDSDDLWLPTKLELQVPLFAKGKDIGLVAGTYHVCDHAGSIIGTRNAVKEKFAKLEKEIFYRNIFATSTTVVKKECFEKVGYFDEQYRYAEDWEMWMRIISSYAFEYLHEPTAVYRTAADQSISGVMSKKNYADWESIINIGRYGSSNPVTRWINHRKAMSWYFFYRSYDEQCLRNPENERDYLLASVRKWPFFFYKRYLALMRVLLGDRYYELYRKMKGSRG